MKRHGHIDVIYMNATDRRRKVKASYPFRGVLSFLKTLIMAYKTRCNDLHITFNPNPTKNDLEEIQRPDSKIA